VNLDNNEISNKNSDPKTNSWINYFLITMLVISLIVAGFALTKRYFSDNQENSANEDLSEEDLKAKNNEFVQKVANKLDGTMVTAEKSRRHPLAIMVENHPESRPQFGLDKASLVYEAITEGGITRFMAIYGPNDASRVGPVRSARTYFTDWLLEFNAFYAHVGGNLDALEKIKKDRILDLDEFELGEKAYKRISRANEAIEHTMYTSTDDLYKSAKDKGWLINDSGFRSFNFKESEKTESSTAQTVIIDFSLPSYKVKWTFNKDKNVYLREMAGKAHLDALTNEQLSASNVIIQSVERWEAPTEAGEAGWAMKTTGSGKAKVFLNGNKIEATWKKTSLTDRTTFYDSADKEIYFNPGSTWIEVVPPDVYKTISIE